MKMHVSVWLDLDLATFNIVFVLAMWFEKKYLNLAPNFRVVIEGILKTKFNLQLSEKPLMASKITNLKLPGFGLEVWTVEF